MDASNWINFGILLLTALGFIFTGRQATQARASAADAKAHEEAALDASLKTAEANERAASALEEANALVRAQTAKPRWKLIQLDDTKYRVDNQGPGSAFDVHVDVLESPNVIFHTGENPRPVLEEGLAISFFRRRTFGTPVDPTLVIAWTDPTTGSHEEVRVTR